MLNDYDVLFMSGIFDFWDKLSQEELSLLIENSVLVCYEKGENIYGGGDDCLGVMLIKSGELRTYILSEDGREITLYRLYEKDVCILSASCLLQNITFDVHIDAERECEIILISSAAFSRLLKNIYVQNFSYKVTIDRFSDVMWAMQQILFMSFDKRLAIFLLDEAAKGNSDAVSLTHQEIAKYMGSAREVVSRMLKYFSDEGIVTLSRGTVRIIDKGRLRQLAK